MEEPAGQITVLLDRINRGDKPAADELFARVYEDLKTKARQVKWDRSGTTSIVNEAYLRLVQTRGLSLAGRLHFYNYAAEAVRRIVIDRFRASGAKKRGGDIKNTPPVDPNEIAVQTTDWLALNEALDHLRVENERQYQIVTMHFFAGREFKEIAELLNVDPKTVSRDWKAARAFLATHLDEQHGATT